MSEVKRQPIDLTKNEKQSLLFKHVKGIAEGVSNKRVIFYGGSIRGGKTIGTLACMLWLALKYPGCKIVIVRSSLPDLRKTTLDSFKMVFPPAIIKSFKQDIMECQLVNGSRILFFAESFDKDKDLNRFKGLECNFILLEQLEELQKITLDKSLERVGSYRMPDGQQPPGIILATFNPTQNWVRTLLYEPFIENKLPKSWLYISASSEDNPFVTKDQKEAWKTMDPISYNRFVLGDWDAVATDYLFAWAFKTSQHKYRVPELKYGDPYFISFDFNLDPMCAIILSHANDRKFYVVDEMRIKNCDVEGMCKAIERKYGRNIVAITGDSSGRTRNQASIQLGSHYDIIKRYFKLKSSQIKVSKANIRHLRSQMICNTVLIKHPDFKISDRCKYLIADLLGVKILPSGSIDKSDHKMGHHLDAWRYAIHAFCPSYTKIIEFNDYGTPIADVGSDNDLQYSLEFNKEYFNEEEY